MRPYISAAEKAASRVPDGAARRSRALNFETELANTHFCAGHYHVSGSLNRRALARHRQLSAIVIRSSSTI
jgi:hypothetical protein